MLDRRQLVSGLTLAAVPAVAGRDRAQAQPYPGWYPVAPGVFDIGIPHQAPVYARQRCQQWCWAAAIETIFGVAGYQIGQEQLVASMFGLQPNGLPPCRPATDGQMAAALERRFIDARGRRFEARRHVAQWNGDGPSTHAWQVIITELTHRRPLLMAYRNSPTSGHAVVCTHVRVRFVDPRVGLHQILGVTVRDPWPDSDLTRPLTLQEARRIGFVAAVTTRPV